jgi:AcrR family transcriptional regulator
MPRIYTMSPIFDAPSIFVDGDYTRDMPQPTGGQGRRRIAPTKGDQRELAILDAAERQLEDNGLDAMTVETIATAAGITRAALYFYFSSKHAVLTALVARTVALLLADLDHADSKAHDPRDALHRSVLRTADMWSKHGSVMRAAVELSPTVPDIDALWQQTVTSTVNTMRAVMIQAGLPDTREPTGAEAVTRSLVWMTERCFYQASRHGLHLTRVADTVTKVWTSVAKT